jgi:hypothetical protein
VSESPIFIFDSRERWYPVGVEESLDAVEAKFYDPDGRRTLAWHPDGGRIDMPADMKPPTLPAVGYHRVKGAAGLRWYQWWLWYLYNPKQYVGFGEHEGDWEFVQVAYTRDGEPVLVTCSQHQTGGARCHWDTETRDDRLVVYVARDSHAAYFAPTRTAEDVADGEGEELGEIEWREFGDWATWRGRWGNSTEQGKSPSSPGRQGDRWHRPHLFHSHAH